MLRNQCSFRHSSLNLPLKLSMYALPFGLPGRINVFRDRLAELGSVQSMNERVADAVSVQAIANQIGLTQPAVFRHFPSKEAVWLAVMTWLEHRLGEIHQSAATAGGSALTVLRHVFNEHLRMVELHPALAKIVFSDHLRLQISSLDDEVYLAAIFGRSLEALGDRHPVGA